MAPSTQTGDKWMSGAKTMDNASVQNYLMCRAPKAYQMLELTARRPVQQSAAWPARSDHTLNFHIERCTFPNWDGTGQKRSVTIMGKEMK